ncbi:FecR domain-containing protein [Sphingomonas sp. QA11]|uniref:FecR family protein n=1 Tax=Sphingomonas sp. QA11 TaxID=2950605 RepID=UPI00234934D6|nr:FecR domain-containing protein [Sphingomonas sp. QA11]WCM25956.1 FecR domain-containing protein [Sphingomonas sp. QA11]
MSDRDNHENPEQLAREAREWIGLIASGEANSEDAAAMMHWRALSPDHAQALGDAVRQRRRLQHSAKALHDDPRTRWLINYPSRKPTAAFSRRTVLGGAVAASAAAVLIVRPPLGLWPSFAELRADYRTGAGEQRTIALAPGLSVELNTRTSIALHTSDQAYGVSLIEGEVAVTVDHASRPAVILTHVGRARSRTGQFGVRTREGGACVTCFDGEVAVEDDRNRRYALYKGRQVAIGSDADPAVVPVDVRRADAWRRGELIFTNQPLGDVVEEINRYRPGRIILVNTALRHIPVNAVFRIRQMDNALSQIREVSDASVTHLPGGVVLLS